ncbi:MAG: P-II family nitrogen regulator [Planctomycetota bacterium]
MQFQGGSTPDPVHTVGLKRVTIVGEAVLQKRLVALIRAAGAKGYTLIDCRGEGSRGVRASEWEGANCKLETLVSAPVANQILAIIARDFFEHFAVVVYVDEVHVVRGEKYV